MSERSASRRLSRRERVAALCHLPALVALVWRVHPRYTIMVVVARLVRSLVPLAALWIAKLIIDAVIASRIAGPDWRHLLILVSGEFLLVVLGDAVTRVSQLYEMLLGDLFDHYTNIRILEHAATFALVQFEDATYYDQLERARNASGGRRSLLPHLLTLVQAFVTLVAISAAIVAQSSLLFFLILASTVPTLLGDAYYAGQQYALLFDQTPRRRELDYLRYLASSDDTAKEILTNGIAPWLITRYRRLARRFVDENRHLGTRRALAGLLLSLITTSAYYGAYVVVLVRAVTGSISVGDLTFLAGAFARTRDLTQQLMSGVSTLAEMGMYLRDYFQFLQIRPAITSSRSARLVPRPIQDGFVFDNVGFRYPSTEHWALRQASFTVTRGEHVALVGPNGAGKTTVIKLLVRLYDPVEGRILLDGVDLREYDPESIRHAVGVVFQDFVRYDMRFDENIGVGNIAAVQTYLDVDHDARGAQPAEKIRCAAEQSTASSILPHLPAGYQQMLGRRFAEGVDLSGGEWQKVALARAYIRDAQVMCFDEPTAALDPRSEYEVFRRFVDLMTGRTAVLVSHRLSTVRMSDRIIVLADGRVQESGTHEDLMCQGALYSELFNLQAEAYR